MARLKRLFGVSSRSEYPQTEAEAPGALSGAEVKAKAAHGAVLFMGRGLVLQGLGFLGSLALARLLVPADFGLVAIGLTVINVGHMLAGAGLGAALIGRDQPPTKRELSAVLGLQLAITTATAAVAAGVAGLIGDSALVTALMVLALPIWAFKTPALLLFQRRLEFVPQIKVEILETVVYLIVAITLAAMGAGAWSLAIATVVRSVSGAVIATLLSPMGVVVPSFRFSPIRSLLGFGARFQAAGLSRLGFDVASTAGIGAIAGLTVLGLWAFATRILSIPRLLFESMWKVGFPSFARLMQSDQERGIGALLERTVSTFAVVVSAILCPLVASSPASVPLLFGPDWTDVSLILPGAALALTIGAPVGIVSSAYLYARGDAHTALVASVITGIVRLAVTLPLLATVGVSALGIGWAAGAVSSMGYTLARVRRTSGARLGRAFIAPAVSGGAGAAAGWAIAEALGVTVASMCAAASVGIAIWALLMLVFAKDRLVDGVALCRRVLASAYKRSGVRGRWQRSPAQMPTEPTLP